MCPMSAGFDHMSAVLQCVIGTYSFGCATISKLPFDSCVYVAEGQEVRYYVVVLCCAVRCGAVRCGAVLWVAVVCCAVL